MLENEIRSLELRKQSVFSAIDGEIARLQSQRSQILLDAGIAAYNTWNEDKIQADLTEFWSKVQELESQIAEQENKKYEMGIKYNEEIQLINSTLNLDNARPMSSIGTGIRCPKCGASLAVNTIFCQECGTKVQ